MVHQGIGLTWKRYWRQIRPGSVWCCFERQRGEKQFTSLCGRYQLAASDGQDSRRPAAVHRCAQCDVAEINGTGADESLPPALSR